MLPIAGLTTCSVVLVADDLFSLKEGETLIQYSPPMRVHVAIFRRLDETTSRQLFGGRRLDHSQDLLHAVLTVCHFVLGTCAGRVYLFHSFARRDSRQEHLLTSIFTASHHLFTLFPYPIFPALQYFSPQFGLFESSPIQAQCSLPYLQERHLVALICFVHHSLPFLVPITRQRNAAKGTRARLHGAEISHPRRVFPNIQDFVACGGGRASLFATTIDGQLSGGDPRRDVCGGQRVSKSHGFKSFAVSVLSFGGGG